MQATLVHRPTSEEDYWTQLSPKDNAEMKKQLARACYVAGALGKASVNQESGKERPP